MTKEKKGAELDKLKRRMIRTVARLIKEKKSEDEVFKELKKQSGGNCRNLWERMRSLTMKKLKRLFDADDRVDLVPSVARMTLTDWLMYDLVIVHEKIDVIDRNQSSNSKVLSNLFALVQMFSIEGRAGNDLAEAWTSATLHYNSKGHQCSPMLMQRRWYQVKELTRHKMYNFWYNYRGNQKLLPNAKEDPPTELQKAIALRYPEIITQPFPEWQERIEKRLIIMPEEFEMKMRKKARMKPPDENAPDVVIVEQKIDTITLGDTDSEYFDEDNSRESNVTSHNPNINTFNDETSQTPIIVQVKTEPQDTFENFDQTAENYENMYRQEPVDRFQEEIERLKMMEDKILSDEENSRDAVTPSHSENQDNTLIINNFAGAAIATLHNKENLIEQEETSINNNNTETQEAILIDDDEDIISLQDFSQAHSNNTRVENESKEIVVDITSPDAKIKIKDNIHRNVGDITAENYDPVSSVENLDTGEPATYNEHVMNNEMMPIITGVTSIDQVELKNEIDTELLPENVEDNLDLIPGELPYQPKIEIDAEEDNTDVVDLKHSNDILIEENTCNITQKESKNIDLPDEIVSTLSFADDGIEFADDGIELDEDDEENENDFSESPVPKADHTEEVPQKFDLKLLMNPVVYTTKLDKMTIFKNRPIYDTVNEKELVDKIVFESKPINNKSINFALPEPKSINVDEVKIEINDPNEQGTRDNTNNISINHDIIEIHDACEDDDDLFHNDSSDESECDVVEESKKVKLSSNLLQKPKSRSYNPIQLCKNPDFNTRLKRLTVGFYTYPRNRILLSACKPMTIDLSKAFESKLISGTMYLKPSSQVVRIENENITESTVSIMPSANPVQSLMDTSKSVNVDAILQEELKKRILERNKTINLPNISVVRQINQHLLMAEVAPIMAQVNTSTTQALVDGEVKGDKITAQANELNCNNSLLTPKEKCPENVVTSTCFHETKKSTNENTTNVPNLPQSITNIPKSLADKNKSKLDRRKRLELIKNTPNWITKSYYDIKNDSDTLLTIDTLYKMLNALDPCQEYASKFNSYKPKKIRKLPEENNSKTQQMSVKPDPKVKTSLLKSHLGAKRQKKSQKESKKSCCWARSKIEKFKSPTPGLMRLNKHRCIGKNCRCCCIDELKHMELHLEYVQTSNAVDSLSEVIEEVVQQSRDSSSISQPAVHIVNVDGNTDISWPKNQVDIGLQADIIIENDKNISTNGTVLENESNLHVSEAKSPVDETVTIDLIDEDENEQFKMKSPTPKIRVLSGYNNPINGNNYTDARTNSQRNLRNRSNTNKDEDKLPLLVTQVTAGRLSKKQTQKQNNQITPTLNADYIPCSCRPKVAVDKASSTLMIDGSKACLRHTNSCISKQTRIYLNRKHMSVTERPFYVGRNKILLTNIKQPKPETPPPDPSQMTLPDGVQVVLLPDGTVTYMVEPNKELTLEETNSMSHILQAVQLQVKASGITLPKPPPAKQQSSITIDIDEDEVVKKLNDPTDESKSECSNIAGESSQESNKVNEESDNSYSESLHTVNEDSNAESYFIHETDLHSKVQNEIINKSQEVPFTISFNSVQNHSVPSFAGTGQSAHIKVNQDSLNEGSAISEIVTDATSDVMEQSRSQIMINQESTLTQHMSVSEVVTNTTSIDMEHSELQKSINQLSTLNEANAVSAKDMTTNNEETNTLICDEVLENNTEPSSMDTSEPRNSTCPVEPIANVNVEISETLTNTEDTNNTNTRRNLFSDLMEMCGIGEEDMVPAPQESVLHEPTVTVMTNSEAVLQPLLSPIVPEMTSGQPEITVPAVSPIIEKQHSISAQIDEKIHELNPVTSFAELKYACDHGGLFFKLDLTNGVIVPINVCIQKSPQVASKFHLGSTDVIDLTDDQGVSLNKQAQVSIDESSNETVMATQNTLQLMPKKLSTMMPVKLVPRTQKIARLSTLLPMRLKRRKDKIPRNSTILFSMLEAQNTTGSIGVPQTAPRSYVASTVPNKKRELLSKLSNNLKPLKTLQTHRSGINILRKNSLPKRPFYADKIDTQIDLVDSDAPMEEEYLIEESSDDSDDEPLAKVAKKMRASENEPNQEPHLYTQDEEVSQDESQDESLPRVDDDIDFEEAIDAIEPSMPLRASFESEPVPTQLVLSGGALNQSIRLPDTYVGLQEADDEDSQEDCILGV